ncbi:hypothetical protein ACXYTJ_04355 [Gilvimarinus sp. F26214L]|uniref:hypothetical protein n=1 Tax=Gilvimarinus sp. DZF01 TaxID=3461371 RepID=UPI004046509A
MQMHTSRQLNFSHCTRRMRWVAVALLLFAQLSLAYHFHDVEELSAGHDCTVCSQLQSVKDTASKGAETLQPEPGSDRPVQAGTSAPVVTAPHYLPPTRAPPLS